MNGHERRRKWDVGVAFLAEAIADVLAEARDKGDERGMTPGDVSWALGFSSDDSNHVCRHVLIRMEEQGETEILVLNGLRQWRLTGE